MDNPSVIFTSPGKVVVGHLPLHELRPGEVRVSALATGISWGTEKLFFQGLIPESMPVDTSIPAYQDKTTTYPLSFGYCHVGRVTAVGSSSEKFWLGRRVFSFSPHQSHLNLQPNALIPIPDDLPDNLATLIPNMETATSLLMDGRPIVGESVLVVGLGVVGSLTAHLLGQIPMLEVLGVDISQERRVRAKNLCRKHRFEDWSELPASYKPSLAFELSGNHQALNQTIKQMTFEGRIIVGSWFGSTPAVLNLGAEFHRQRLQLISSQVSHLSPSLGAITDKTRRLQQAIKYLTNNSSLSELITHHVSIKEAPEIFNELQKNSGSFGHIVLNYEKES